MLKPLTTYSVVLLYLNRVILRASETLFAKYLYPSLYEYYDDERKQIKHKNFKNKRYEAKMEKSFQDKH